jgi:hypothetical protein
MPRAAPVTTCSLFIYLFFILFFMSAFFFFQLHGAGGFCDDFPLAFLYAQSRALSMADGPDEVRPPTAPTKHLKKLKPHETSLSVCEGPDEV